jgi:hypothetical protein
MPTCSDCRWFTENTDEIGHCHGHTPIGTKDGDNTPALWGWPEVLAIDHPCPTFTRGGSGVRSGDDPADGGPKKITTVYLTERQHDWLSARADACNVSFAAVLRRAVDRYIDDTGDGDA